ncbi:hypothetical protein Tco_0281131 [Tanacetum coccineum]
MASIYGLWHNYFMIMSIDILKIDINYAAGGNLRRLSVEEAWETIEDCAQCDKQWKNPTSTILDQTIANLKAHLVENEVVRVMIPKCMSWLDSYDEHIGDRRIRKIIQAHKVPHKSSYQLRLYLMRRSLEVLRKFHQTILEGRFNQLSHVSSTLLSKPGEY